MIHRRHLRKGLGQTKLLQPQGGQGYLQRLIWHPWQLNRLIGTLFALGSLLFVLGGVLSLVPSMVTYLTLKAGSANLVFFCGSIPFTAAAYLQLFQSANAPKNTSSGRAPPATVVYFGWQPLDIGWLSSSLQFLGTLLFNINTLDGILPNLDWLQQDLAVWVPDIVGSALFLASGYLAFVECCQTRWAWRPNLLAWKITFINLLGCVAFMLAAIIAFVPSSGGPMTTAVTVSTLFTVLGATAFLIGSALLIVEANQG